MRSRALLLLLGSMSAGWALVSHGADEAQSPCSRTELSCLVEGFVSAWNRSDPDALASLFAEHGQLHSPTGQAQDRREIRELLAARFGDVLKGTRLKPVVDRVVYPHEGTAVVSGAYRLNDVRVLFGIRTSQEGNFTFRLIRRGGRWLIENALISS